MNQEKLEKLRIQSSAKERSSGSLWIIFIGVAVVIAVALYFFWPRASDSVRIIGGKKADASSKTATPGSAAAPSTQNNTATKPTSAPGRVENSVLTVSGYIVNRERIEISPRFLGVVKWIGVKKGDSVTNGQVVVLLDDAEQRARIAEIEGRLTNAHVAIAKAELDYQRIATLTKTDIESRQSEDDARLRLAGARASLKEVEGSHQLARTYLDWTVIRSPVNGVVLEKIVDAGELVTPQSFGGGRGPSTAVIAVANPEDLQVEIDMNEADLAKIFLNQPCKVSPEAYRDQSYDGYVAEIAPEANRQKGTLTIKVQIKNPDKFLTPELTAQVDFLKSAP